MREGGEQNGRGKKRIGKKRTRKVSKLMQESDADAKTKKGFVKAYNHNCFTNEL